MKNILKIEQVLEDIKKEDTIEFLINHIYDLHAQQCEANLLLLEQEKEVLEKRLQKIKELEIMEYELLNSAIQSKENFANRHPNPNTKP